MMTRVLPSALCICLSPLLAAQQASPPTSPYEPRPVSSDSKAPAAPDTVRLRGTTIVRLRLEQAVGSASAHKGDRIRFTLLFDLLADGKVVAPAGTPCYATVADARPMTDRRSGLLKFSDAALDLGNGQRIRLSEGDGQDEIGPEAIPVIIVGAVTIGPLVVAMLPVQLSIWAIHSIREHRQGGPAHYPKPDPEETDLSEGEHFTYHTRGDTRIHLDRIAIPAPSTPKSAE
jgi:hypothetical protein